MHTKRRDSTGWPLGKAILESAHVCDYHVGATESAVGGSQKKGNVSKKSRNGLRSKQQRLESTDDMKSLGQVFVALSSVEFSDL